MSAEQKWLFLDFDNTLMGTEQHAVPSLIDRFNMLYADKLPAPLTFDTFKANFHGQARETLCTNLSAFYGIEVDCALLYEDREWNMMRHYQKLPNGVPMAKGLMEVLEPIAREGYRLALVTNNPVQRAFTGMRFADNKRGDDLCRLFGTSFFEAGDKQKPKPDVYLRAMEQLGTSPSDCCTVEDSLSGVKSAVAAGIKVYGYTGFSDKPEKLAQTLMDAGCCATFYDWAEFPALFKS